MKYFGELSKPATEIQALSVFTLTKSAARQYLLLRSFHFGLSRRSPRLVSWLLKVTTLNVRLKSTQIGCGDSL